MRFYKLYFFVALPVILICSHHGVSVSGLSSLETSNTNGKHQKIPISPYYKSQYTQQTLFHQNITSEVNNVTSRSELPVLPEQGDNLSISKNLQDLYHEAYLLLKDVIKTRKLNINTSTIDAVQRNMQTRDSKNNETSTSLLGQSPLPPFKTRQKTSTFNAVNGVTPNLNMSETKLKNYVKKSNSTAQTNFISALLGGKLKHKKTAPDETSFTSSFTKRTKQFLRHNTEGNSKKVLLWQNVTQKNGLPKNTATEKRTQEMKIVNVGENRDKQPDDTCFIGGVKYNHTLTLGLKAGQFTEESGAETIKDCIYRCCSKKSCDVAFMLKESCFLVKCHNKSSCYSRPAKSLSFKPRLAHVFRRAQHDLSRPVEKGPEEKVPRLCKSSDISKIFTNVQLRGGSEAGNFTNKGTVASYHQCVGYCCQDKRCNVALISTNNCFLVACKTYSDCLLDKATNFNSKVVYVNWEKPTEKVLTKGKIFYKNLGCWHEDARLQNLISLEGTDNLLLDSYKSRKNATMKCATAARKRNFKVFALHNGGECRSGQNASEIYHAHGRSRGCYKGTGDHVSNYVYHVKENGSVVDHGCWKAIQREENFVTLESTDGRIREKYKERDDPLLKCAEAAMTQQHTLFALRDGGQCLAGDLKNTTYNKHGVSKLCADGLGSASSKSVYQIIGTTQLFLQQNKDAPSLSKEGKPGPQNNAEHGAPQSKNRQQKVNKSSALLKTSILNDKSSKNSSKTLYKHSSPQALVFVHGLKAGHFTVQGEVNNMDECIQYCGRQLNCSAAFMVRRFCFSVKCHSKKFCETEPSLHSEFNPKLSFVTHLSPSMTSLKDKEETKTHETKPFPPKIHKKGQQKPKESSVLLKTSVLKSNSSNNAINTLYKHSSPQALVFVRGLKAGHFTSQGEVDNMDECIQYCGQQLNCSAAFMVRRLCFTVKCHSKKFCETEPALDSGYNVTLSFVTHLSPSITSQEDEGKTKLADETRPFVAKTKESSPLLKTSILKDKSKNAIKTLYKHSSPQALVFVHGLKTGHFTVQGEVDNMDECIQYCGQQLNCSAAFMVRSFCFTVKCHSKKFCETEPALDSGYNPKLSFITHLPPPMTSQTEPGLPRRCIKRKIYENVTLFGGINAGDFTDFGPKENMSECIMDCCKQKHCDVAFMLGNDCYGVQCKTKHLCGTTPAKHVKKYRPRLAYMDSERENKTAESRSLSSCWNGKTLVNHTLTGGIDAGIFYSNGNTDTMSTCMKYCCEQHDCDLAFRIDQGCYTVHCKDQEQCRARKARTTHFLPQIAFKRLDTATDKGELHSPSKARHGSCQIGETHFNATLKMGMHSGEFMKLGEVDNMEDCVEMSCREKDIDAAFMFGKYCYSVKCYNSDLCQIRPAFVSNIDTLNVNPAVAFIHNDNDYNDYTRSEIGRRCAETTIKQNTTLLGKIRAGTFIDNGERRNIQDCISACCNTPSCDVALMNGKKCFSVHCNGNKSACQEVSAKSSGNKSTLAYVARYMDTEHTQELELSASSSQCPRESLNELHVYKNKTLLGGFETGNYTFLGRTKNMQKCIQKCCSLGKCDVAYSIDGNCYGIECFSKSLCHVDDRAPDTTSTEISIVKNLNKINQSRHPLISYILATLSVLLVVFIVIAWLYWIRFKRTSKP